MCLVTQLCLTLCNPMDYSLPGSRVHELLQAGLLEWIVFPFSRESSQSRDQIWVSCIAGGFFTVWATKEAHIPIRKIKIKIVRIPRNKLNQGGKRPVLRKLLRHWPDKINQKWQKQVKNCHIHGLKELKAEHARASAFKEPVISYKSVSFVCLCVVKTVRYSTIHNSQDMDAN